MKIDLETTIGGFNFELLRTMSYQATAGAELGECLATAERVRAGDFDSWVNEWMRTADRVAQDADGYLRRGERVGARGAFLRASNYYRTAEFYATRDDARRVAAWRHSRECFHQAAILFSPPIEPLEIPFERNHLPGYFVRGGEGKRPTLIAITGFDGSGEELYHLIGGAAAERGWHCLMFEGPGQRGALYLNSGLTLRPDFEMPVRAVVDYALTRSDVDGDRLAVIGYSLGGYLAARAAAFEPRIRACIADPLGVDLDATWAARFPARLLDSPRMFNALFALLERLKPEIRWGMDQARWALGVQQPYDLVGEHGWKHYHLWDTTDRWEIPLLVLMGEDEVTGNGSRQALLDIFHFVEALKSDVTFRLFTHEEGGSSHCQIGNLSRAQEAVFEWLETALGAETGKTDKWPRVKVPATLVSLIKKHHGNELAGLFEKHETLP